MINYRIIKPVPTTFIKLFNTTNFNIIRKYAINVHFIIVPNIPIHLYMHYSNKGILLNLSNFKLSKAI